MALKTKTFGQKEVHEEPKKNVPPRQPKSYLENRKSSPRSRQFKKVQIIFNNGFCTHDAILRDMSDDGARIETKHVLDIPDVFTMKFTNDNTTKRCRIVWRGKEHIGAKFTSPSPEAI